MGTKRTFHTEDSQMLGTAIQIVVYLGDVLPRICVPLLAKGMCSDFQQEQEICHFSTAFSSVLGSTQHVLQLVLVGALPRGRVAGA